MPGLIQPSCGVWRVERFHDCHFCALSNSAQEFADERYGLRYSSKPPRLFRIECQGASCRSFRDFQPALAEHLRLIHPDNRRARAPHPKELTICLFKQVKGITRSESLLLKVTTAIHDTTAP